MSSLIAICIMLFSGISIAYNVALLRKSRKMKAREKELIKNGVNPYGSGLCHGMVLDGSNKAVKHDSKKTNSWYARLI